MRVAAIELHILHHDGREEVRVLVRFDVGLGVLNESFLLRAGCRGDPRRDLGLGVVELHHVVEVRGIASHGVEEQEIPDDLPAYAETGAQAPGQSRDK